MKQGRRVHVQLKKFFDWIFFFFALILTLPMNCIINSRINQMQVFWHYFTGNTCSKRRSYLMISFCNRSSYRCSISFMLSSLYLNCSLRARKFSSSTPILLEVSFIISVNELHVFYKHNAYKHIQAQILQKLRHCLSICWASILQNFKAFIPQFTKNTHNMQIAPSHKHSIGIF